MNHKRLSSRSWWLVALAASLPLAATGCDTDGPAPTPNPPVGATEFVSADGYAGQESGDPATPVPPEAGEPDDGRDSGDPNEPTVEEGDIYRVVGDGLLLNLNRYRGLQIIDVSDPRSPAIVGALPVTGSPVEMYGDGDRAVVLLNGWRGYYGSRDDVALESAEGGLVMTVDLSDPTNPTLLDQAHVPGYIQTSRLTRGDASSALYVAATEWVESTGPDGSRTSGPRTVVKSFDVSGDTIAMRSEFDLGGYVDAIQATPQMLLVARTDWYSNDNSDSSDVTLIDISNTDGTMVERDTVAVAGKVVSQFHMDFRGDMLRVLSGPRWGGGQSSHLETWDATDPDKLVAIDSEAFGTGDNLFAAIFLEDRAFAVTYLRQDPFHAFSITPDGQVQEESEYIVSGWNDFFRPVLDNSRLVGVGIDDANGGREVAVSLYDITDLTNPEPLVARAEVEGSTGGWSWSEANWDHRAFTVLDQAVEVQAASGETETGLVLLPFSGWNDNESRYVSAVQIYTFSANTLTRRGVMENSDAVRRSFVIDSDLAANLSDSELGLFNHATPDTPESYSSLALAPNYTELLAFGDYRARIIGVDDWYWYVPVDQLRPTVVEIIPADANADQAEPVAQFEIPATARTFAIGDLLVAMTMEKDYEDPKDRIETRFVVFDLSDPTSPQRRGDFVTDELDATYGYGYLYDCLYCRWSYHDFSLVNVVGEALTFVNQTQQQASIGTEETCVTEVYDYANCSADSDCSYYSGYESCSSLNGASPVCYGEIAYCTYHNDTGDTSCEPVDVDDINDPDVTVYNNCETREAVRYWQQYGFDSVDFSNPDQPQLTPSVSLPVNEEGVSVLADGDTLYASVKRPVNVPGDPRPYVRYAIMAIDYSNPAAPTVGPAINVPGELLVISGDTIYTRDLVWGDKVAETAIAQLRLGDDRAYLQGHRRFIDRQVEDVAIDDRGLALVSHRPLWNYGWDYNSGNNLQTLTVLSPSSGGLTELSEVEVDSWATLRTVTAQRALFQVPGGLLVLNLEDPAQPSPQAFFATPGWPSAMLVDGDQVMFPAGRYGIYEFGLDTFNLLTPNQGQ